MTVCYMHCYQWRSQGKVKESGLVWKVATMSVGSRYQLRPLPCLLAVSARMSDIQTLHHGVSLSAWYRPWILLGGLQAHIRDLFSPATAFGLQYRRRGSCHTPVFTWRPSIPSRRSSSVERANTQCHLSTIFVLIPATPEDISFPVTTASITLITVLWSWSALALSTTLILENWTELLVAGTSWDHYHVCW